MAIGFAAGEDRAVMAIDVLIRAGS